jgi:microcystin-dependent protein
VAEPFLSEIRIMSFDFAPKGWAMCNGQLLPINQNQPLFSLLGTTFGGDGRVNFALPDQRGKTPIHVGSGHTLGETGGSQAVTLNIQQIPQHLHFAQAATVNSDVNVPSGNNLASVANLYSQPTDLHPLVPSTIGGVGGSQPHNNMQPFLTLTFCIALQGIFPSPN